MSQFIRFSFPLSPRMQSFLQLRDGLACLAEANADQQPYVWLQACADLHISLFGEQGRRAALSDVIGLLGCMQDHLDALASEHPQYCEQIMRSCATLEGHEKNLRGGVDEAKNILTSDALISAWMNGLKKHDWLGHRKHMPHALHTLWHNSQRREAVHNALRNLSEAVSSMHGMLHDYVAWESHLAEGGGQRFRLDSSKPCGLLIVGLTPAQVDAGLIPDISGNHMAVRLRFQRWLPTQASVQVDEDVPYQCMQVPIA